MDGGARAAGYLEGELGGGAECHSGGAVEDAGREGEGGEGGGGKGEWDFGLGDREESCEDGV